MNHTLLRWYALLLLLGVGVLGVKPVYAARVQCTSQTMSNLSFGDIDPQSSQKDVTATFTVTCGNTGIANVRGATICLSIGVPGGGTVNSRLMSNGSATLGYQLYQDPSRTIIWGSQFSAGSDLPLQFDVLVPPRGSLQFSASLFGRVSAGQTAVIPGAYVQNYAPVDTRMTVNAPLTGNTAPGSCNQNPGQNETFPFLVSADVVNKCTITASPLDFGTNPGLLNTAVNASTTLGVQCSIGTAYNVGLDAGQNGGGNINARKMMLGTSSVGYQLYRDLSRTQVWGTTIGSNTVAATGNGSTQNLTVYGSVPPQTTPPAGTYNDTVIVTVTY